MTDSNVADGSSDMDGIDMEYLPCFLGLEVDDDDTDFVEDGVRNAALLVLPFV